MKAIEAGAKDVHRLMIEVGHMLAPYRSSVQTAALVALLADRIARYPEPKQDKMFTLSVSTIRQLIPVIGQYHADDADDAGGES